MRVYAPVGGHRDLLAYLVRRLLENGANSSFVSVAADPAVPIAAILRRPQSWIGDAQHARHPNIPLAARPLCARRGAIRPASNSATARASPRCSRTFATRTVPTQAAPLIDGIARPGAERAGDRRRSTAAAIGSVREGDDAVAAAAMAAAAAGFARWSATPIDAAPLRSNARAICSKRGAAV